MKVTIKFLDGEEIEGDSEAASLTKMGFPTMVQGGNNSIVWVSLAGIKYVLLYGGALEEFPGHEDPRASDDQTKVVLHFLDGDTIRTYKDDSFGQEGEGFHMRIWRPELHRLIRVLVPLQALKALFFVKEWDSRVGDEKRYHELAAQAGVEGPAAVTSASAGPGDTHQDRPLESRRSRPARSGHAAAPDKSHREQAAKILGIEPEESE